MEMKDRDLYFYINAPTPYRKHMFQLYAKSFRTALFHFYQTTTCHPTWDLKCDDWGIDYVYDRPEDQIGFGRLKFTKRMLKRFFTQRRGSVYIGSMTTWGDRMLLNILGFLRLAVVLDLNDAGFAEGISAWQRFKNRINGFGINGVLTPGVMGRRYSKAYGYCDSQIVNCHFSHDEELFRSFYLEHHDEARSEVRHLLGIPNEAVVALTISRFMALKRLEDAAAALLALEGLHGDKMRVVHYVLIGQGEWHAHEEMLKELKYVGVHVIPDVSPVEVMKYYCAADFQLFPSEGDIWGLAVNESMSMHLPVICTRVIGAAELVKPGVNGYVVNPRNPSQLADAISELVFDEEKRIRMGIESFEAIKSWRTERGLENLAMFLKRK